MAYGKKILYFIKGTSPTEDEFFKAGLLGTSMFRAVTFYNEFDAVEICDGVAGEAPEVYRKRFGYVEPPKVVPVQEAKPAPAPPAPPAPQPPTSWSKGA